MKILGHYYVRIRTLKSRRRLSSGELSPEPSLLWRRRADVLCLVAPVLQHAAQVDGLRTAKGDRERERKRERKGERSRHGQDGRCRRGHVGWRAGRTEFSALHW